MSNQSACQAPSSIGVARIIATVSAAGCLDLATFGGLTWGWGRIWPWMMDDFGTLKMTKCMVCLINFGNLLVASNFILKFH